MQFTPLRSLSSLVKESKSASGSVFSQANLNEYKELVQDGLADIAGESIEARLAKSNYAVGGLVEAWEMFISDGPLDTRFEEKLVEVWESGLITSLLCHTLACGRNRDVCYAAAEAITSMVKRVENDTKGFDKVVLLEFLSCLYAFVFAGWDQEQDSSRNLRETVYKIMMAIEEITGSKGHPEKKRRNKYVYGGLLGDDYPEWFDCPDSNELILLQFYASISCRDEFSGYVHSPVIGVQSKILDKKPIMFDIERIECRNLPAVDHGKSSDPYILMIHKPDAVYPWKPNNKYGKTKAQKKELNPIWSGSDISQEETFLKNDLPDGYNEFEIQIWDKNSVMKDELLGSVRLDLFEVLSLKAKFAPDEDEIRVVFLDINAPKESKSRTVNENEAMILIDIRVSI
eukprot:TRINITY_DN5562_c0_g1_i1.p1 TRINITY_DN5562_c0_g1~~TRINITY_DN5562_c0_g1_i1.p1  ORF type:complete len:401 (-),score=80.25 TRINITY_DN5562_c0_g1_i1:1165-2367(-)